MFGPLIFIRGTRPLSPETRTQAAFNQFVREIRAAERALTKASRLMRRRPWKRFEIGYYLGRGMVSEFQLHRLLRCTGDPMFRQALGPARELNEALEYAQAAIDERVLDAALTDVSRAQLALAEVQKAIDSVMSLRFQRWGHHFGFDEPSVSRDYDLLEYLSAVAKE